MQLLRAISGTITACLASTASMAGAVWAAAPGPAPTPANVDLAQERTAIEAFQALDQRLQDIGWKLARGNAGFCRNARPTIGLQLHDMASYGAPDIARAALGLKRDFAVQTAAMGSPAQLSGEFPTNREIRFLAGEDPNGWEAGARLDWKRLTRAHDYMENELARAGSITVTFDDGKAPASAPTPARASTLKPVFACATRFELAGDNRRAAADGSRVIIGARFPGFAYGDELFAAAIAHELAHNLLGHRDWLDRNGRKRSNIRASEREADKLMPWLLANAGYDPAAAARFFREYKPESGGALFLRGSHDKWDKRAEAVEAELPRIAALMESGGTADWSVHFTRMTGPKKERK